MISENEKQIFLCERLQRLGFVSGRRLRLYGEEFELVSDPAPDGQGYGIEGVSRKSGLRHVRIPVSVTQMIENEICSMEPTKRQNANATNHRVWFRTPERGGANLGKKPAGAREDAPAGIESLVRAG